MLPEKMMDVLQHEGVVAIATQGESGPHLVNTWNSYVPITDDQRLLIPVGGMKTTEANVTRDDRVLLTLGAREVQGFRSMGTGFLIEGNAAFLNDGSEFDRVKGKFPWARAALAITVRSAKRTL